MTPLVLLAGMMCDARLFGQQLAALSASRQCIVPDLAQHRNWDELAELVVSEAPAQFDVLGISFGGALALEICARWPDRVRRAIIMDANPHRDTADRRRERQALVDYMNAHGLRALMWDRLLPHYLSPSNTDTTLLDLCWDMAETQGPDVFRTQTEALLGRRSRLERLGSFAAPVLILRGAQDRICPRSYHTDLAAALPNATYEEICGAGHLPVLEAPEHTTRKIETWLN